MQPILYLAPIRGATDRIYRTVLPQHFKGFDQAVAPFVSTSHKNQLKKNFLKEFEPKHCSGLQTIPQILSNDHQDFTAIANSLFEMGHPIINWNLGCPFPMVVNKGKGSGLLPYPGKIASILDATIPATQANISIKLRLGYSSTDEIIKLIPVLNQYPLHEIIIHPRTAVQMYDGTVDLDVFEQCLALSQHPVVYNGDIVSVAVFNKLASRFCTVNSWMIGRGALYNPFLAEEIKNGATYSDTEKINILYNFHNMLFAEYSKELSGPVHTTDKLKNLWSYLSCCFDNDKKIRKKIKKTASLKKYHEVVEHFFKDEAVLRVW